MNNKELYEDYIKTETHPWIAHAGDVYDKYVSVWNETRIERNGCTSQDKYLYPYCIYEGVVDGGVEFQAEETWQYGGYDFHTVVIPLKYFLCEDDSLLEELKLERADRKESHLKAEKEAETTRKRKQLEKLKQELGG